MSEEAIVNHYILSHMFGRQRTLRIDWPFESIALDKVLSNTFSLDFPYISGDTKI